jgi:hypothetical protein
MVRSTQQNITWRCDEPHGLRECLMCFDLIINIEIYKAFICSKLRNILRTKTCTNGRPLSQTLGRWTSGSYSTNWRPSAAQKRPIFQPVGWPAGAQWWSNGVQFGALSLGIFSGSVQNMGVSFPSIRCNRIIAGQIDAPFTEILETYQLCLISF